jgi:RNA polymerase sigma factor (sigma-70 family)
VLAATGTRGEGRRGSMDVEERFNALYRAHHAAILRYASRRIDPDSAMDVVAETFLVAWRKMPAVPADPDQVEPWLYGVARRVIANTERSRRRAQRTTARLWQESQDEQVPDPATAVTERQRVAEALSRLPARDQEALRLIGWEELDLAGAAIAMGCTRSAMAVRLHRARRRLDREFRSIDTGEPQQSVVRRQQIVT